MKLTSSAFRQELDDAWQGVKLDPDRLARYEAEAAKASYDAREVRAQSSAVAFPGRGVGRGGHDRRLQLLGDVDCVASAPPEGLTQTSGVSEAGALQKAKIVFANKGDPLPTSPEWLERCIKKRVVDGELSGPSHKRIEQGFISSQTHIGQEQRGRPRMNERAPNNLDGIPLQTKPSGAAFNSRKPCSNSHLQRSTL